MSKDLKQHKPFAQSEREQLRELFIRRACEAPVPDPFSPSSMTRWYEYVEEMRELECMLRAAGEQL